MYILIADWIPAPKSIKDRREESAGLRAHDMEFGPYTGLK